MSSSVNPNGALVSRNDATQYTIVSSTATSPIVVNLNTAALTWIGDFVEVTGHLVNTGANGRWQVTNVAGGGTQLTLGGTTGSSAGGATGFVRDFSVNPQIVIPSTGDAATAASVGNPMSAQIAAAIPYLAQRTGNWRLHLAQEISLYAPSGPSGFGTAWLVLPSSSATQPFTSPFPLSILDVPANESVFVDVSVVATFSIAVGSVSVCLYPVFSNATGPVVYDYQHGYSLEGVVTAVPVVLRAAAVVGIGAIPVLGVNWVYGPWSGGSAGLTLFGPATASVRVYRQ